MGPGWVEGLVSVAVLVMSENHFFTTRVPFYDTDIYFFQRDDIFNDTTTTRPPNTSSTAVVPIIEYILGITLSGGSGIEASRAAISILGVRERI